MEVIDGIHRIEASLGNRVNCVYLFVGEDRSVLVDTGTAEVPESVLLPYLDEQGIDPKRLEFAVVTHSDVDHMGGNAALKDSLPEVRVVCHEQDRAMIENVELLISDRYGEWADDHGIVDPPELKDFYRQMATAAPVDLTVVGGESIRLGEGWRVEVLHTPGHSPGSISVYDPRSGTAVIGDGVLYDAILTTDGQPAFPPTYRNVDPYLQTIDKLQALGLSRLLTSHYPPYAGDDVAKFLTTSREFVETLDRATIEALAHGEHTLVELTAAIGPRVGKWGDDGHGLLAFPLTGHLERLEQSGRVEHDGKSPRRYRAVDAS